MNIDLKGLPNVTVKGDVLVRVAGLPLDVMGGLQGQELQLVVDDLASAEDRLSGLRDPVSAALHGAVGRTTDLLARRRLLALRRRLFSASLPSASDAELLSDRLHPGESSLLDEYLGLLERHRALREKGLVLYERTLALTRDHFRRQLGDEDFQKGLLLSSHALSRNLGRYVKDAIGKLDSRSEQIERGLLRYFTRAATKATPFGRFCTLIRGHISLDRGPEQHSSSRLTIVGDIANKRGQVRLNKSLYSVLWSHLEGRPAVKERLGVLLNPTIRAADTNLLFLRARGTRETFQRMARSDALDDILSEMTGADCTFADLLNVLASERFGPMDRADAVVFADRLIELGLLQLRPVVPDQTADWDLPLAAFLEPLADDHAQLVAETLVRARNLVAAYSLGDIDQRVSVSHSLRELISDTLSRLGLSSRIPRDLPVFEDATADAELNFAATPSLRAALDELAQLIDLTRVVAVPRSLQATIRQFFDATYPAGATVPLLTFYEDFYRDHQKNFLRLEALSKRDPHAEALRGTNIRNPLHSPHVAAILHGIGKMQDLIREAWKEAPHACEIRITPEQLKRALADVPPVKRRWGSAAVFCQIVPGSDRSIGDQRIFLSGAQTLVGHGKYLSRFLDLFDADWTHQVMVDNAGFSEDALAEIGSDGDFNANLHPKLLPLDIAYPSGPARDRSALRCADLVVSADADDALQVAVAHPSSGRRVWAMDMGFLNSVLRPPLFQLLSRLGPCTSFMMPVPEEPVARRPRDPHGAEEGEASIQVVYRPRIVFGQGLVLTRKRWTVPHSLFPSKAAGEGDANYFLRVDGWRRKHGLPRTLYARVFPGPFRAGSKKASVEQPEHIIAAREGAVAQHDPSRGAQTEDGGSPGAQNLAEPKAEGEGARHDLPNGAQVEHGTSAAAQKQAEAKEGARAVQLPPVRDYHKPQYIDFGSPLLIKLFSRLPGALKEYRVVMEECYPEACDLPMANDRVYAYELVLHVDHYERDGGRIE